MAAAASIYPPTSATRDLTKRWQFWWVYVEPWNLEVPNHGFANRLRTFRGGFSLIIIIGKSCNSLSSEIFEVWLQLQFGENNFSLNLFQVRKIILLSVQLQLHWNLFFEFHFQFSKISLPTTSTIGEQIVCHHKCSDMWQTVDTGPANTSFSVHNMDMYTLRSRVNCCSIHARTVSRLCS